MRGGRRSAWICDWESAIMIGEGWGCWEWVRSPHYTGRVGLGIALGGSVVDLFGFGEALRQESVGHFGETAGYLYDVV